MRTLKRIIRTVLSFVALLFVFNAYTQTADPLQVLKEETANSKRTWRRGAFTPAITTYEDFEFNSCTLTFRTKTFNKDKKRPVTLFYFPQIYKYAFPLKSMEARLEWLDTYKSYVVSLSGTDSVITIEDSTPPVFYKNMKGNKGPSPNISIPFASENNAKRVMMALQAAIDACGGKEHSNQIMNSAGQAIEDLAPNDEKYKVKVNVDLVTTDVAVIGDNVPELRAEDFVVYDKGVAQRISNFSHDLPISIALVLEAQTAQFGLAEVPIAMMSVLQLLKSGDQAALYSLNGDRFSNLTEDRLYIAKLVSFLADDQKYDNNIFGTLYDAARYLKQEASSRRAIILINWDSPYADGIGDHRWLIGTGELNRAADRVRTELLESSTTLYYATSANRYTQDFKKQLKDIAEDTGGEMLEVIPNHGLRETGPIKIGNRLSAPKKALDQAINRLRTQYTLGFTPSNPGEQGSFHELTVRLANKDRCPTCKVQARRGYYTGVAAPPPSPKRAQAKPVQSSSEIDNYLIQQIMVTAGSSYYDLDDISFAIENTVKIENPNGQSQLRIDLSINPAGIDTTILEGQRAYRMLAALFYADKAGKSVGSNFWEIKGFLEEESANRVVEKGIPFSAVIPIKADDQMLKIVLYDEISGSIACKFTKKKGKGLVIDPHPWYRTQVVN
jgi:VWFA-related protein